MPRIYFFCVTVSTFVVINSLILICWALLSFNRLLAVGTACLVIFVLSPVLGTQ